MKPAQNVPLSVARTFLPPLAGAAGPTSALTSAAMMTTASRISAPHFAPAVAGFAIGRCEAGPMKNSIGVDSMVFVREATPARAPRGAAAGVALAPGAPRSAQ